MGTMENLAAAFAGESQANRKYLAFAAKADKDGFPQVAKLFRAAAEAETVHAHAHLKAMGGINTTLENLEEAVAGEAVGQGQALDARGGSQHRVPVGDRQDESHRLVVHRSDPDQIRVDEVLQFTGQYIGNMRSSVKNFVCKQSTFHWKFT